MPIYKYRSLVQEVLVCKKCGHPVEGSGHSEYYSCSSCDCWVTAVEWKKQEIT